MSLFPSSDVTLARSVASQANILGTRVTRATPNNLPLDLQNGSVDVTGNFFPNAQRGGYSGSLLQLNVNRKPVGGLPVGAHELFNSNTSPPVSLYNGRVLNTFVPIPRHLNQAYDIAKSSGRISANIAGPAIAAGGALVAGGLLAMAYPNSFLDKFLRGVKRQIQERVTGDPAAAR